MLLAELGSSVGVLVGVGVGLKAAKYPRLPEFTWVNVYNDFEPFNAALHSTIFTYIFDGW